jgi:hypothetical protein
MSCHCIDQINDAIASKNTRLSLTIKLSNNGSATPTIMTEKINSRAKGRAISVLPSYCCFCGKKYED